MLERTLAMIKPDAVGDNHDREIINRLESQGFRVVCSRRERLSREEAKAFYEVHRGKPFFDPLLDFMSSGEIVALLLEKEDAIADLRNSYQALFKQ